MNNIKTRFYSFFFIVLSCLFTISPLRPVEIPLDSIDGGRRVAYVNMHKIFEAFPETENARVELNKLIDEKKLEISSKKETIAQLKGEIEILKKQILAVSQSTQGAVASTASVSTAIVNSTASLPIIASSSTLAQTLKGKESLLSSNEADLDAFVGISEEEIKNMEEGKTMTLLAKIYKIVERIAKEEEYSIIVEKSNILYGEGTVDITERVLSKLKLQ